MNNTKLSGLIQFIKFGLVGVVNTMVSYLTYSILFYFGISALLCNIPAFIISVFVSFLLNSRFVFKKTDNDGRKWWQVLIKTYVSYSFTGLFLAEVLTWFWLYFVHIENYLSFALPILVSLGINLSASKFAGYIVPFLNLIVSVPVNFLLNKFWAYKK